MIESAALYAWGANSHGQLGLGIVNEMELRPRQVHNLPCPAHSIAVILAGGGGHVLIYTDTGHLYGCGWNNKKQLTDSIAEDQISQFQEISTDFLRTTETLVHISCGWESSALLTCQGRLFVFGANTFRQLGFTEPAIISRPTELKLSPDEGAIRDVALGMRQIVIRTDKSIYWAGKSKVLEALQEMENVQRYKGHCLDLWQLQIAVDHIACGQHHLLYAIDSKISGIGLNKYDQAVNFELAGKVKRLTAGWSHNACLLETGAMYLWGRNNYGQLGLGQASDSEANARPLETAQKIEAIHAGSEHCLAVDSSGCITTWGWNEHGNCGNGSEDNQLEPSVLDLPGQCILAAAGAGFCLALIKPVTVVHRN